MAKPARCSEARGSAPATPGKVRNAGASVSMSRLRTPSASKCSRQRGWLDDAWTAQAAESRRSRLKVLWSASALSTVARSPRRPRSSGGACSDGSWRRRTGPHQRSRRELPFRLDFGTMQSIPFHACLMCNWAGRKLSPTRGCLAVRSATACYTRFEFCPGRHCGVLNAN